MLPSCNALYKSFCAEAPANPNAFATSFSAKPYYCHNCGAPYPWTQKILDNAVELLSLDDELDSSSKELIKSAIPDLIVDTPTTPIAIAKYRKGIANAGQIIKDSLRQLLIDVISETAKKTLFS